MQLNKYVPMFFLLVITFPLLTYSQKNGYTINGKIEGLQDEENVLLIMHDGIKWDQNSINQTVVENEAFHLEGEVPNGPRLYMLAFDKHPNKQCILVIDNENISIKGNDIDKLLPGNIREYLIIEGSRTDYGWASLINANRLYVQTMSLLNRSLRELKEATEYNLKLAGGIVMAKENLNRGLYGVWFSSWYEAKNPAFPLLLDELSRYINHGSVISTIYDSLDENAKRTFYGGKLKDAVKLCVGQPFPAFTLKDSAGKSYSLKDLIAKNKITLVHFWASNSLSRNQLQKELKEEYSRYNAKGLAIIGISSDTSFTAFKKTISVEKLPWPNVSDLKGRQGIVETLYKEYGRPGAPNTTNVLLDSTGKIVAWDVIGIELHWHLWKALEN